MARPSAHFAWHEFRCRDGTPVPVWAHDDVARLCTRYLERLRAVYGPIIVISGYRTPEHNRAVGGAPASYHVCRHGRPGAAADIACRRGTPREWYMKLAELDPGGLGLYGEHVHVDNRDGPRARW